MGFGFYSACAMAVACGCRPRGGVSAEDDTVRRQVAFVGSVVAETPSSSVVRSVCPVDGLLSRLLAALLLRSLVGRSRCVRPRPGTSLRRPLLFRCAQVEFVVAVRSPCRRARGLLPPPLLAGYCFHRCYPTIR